MLLLAVALTLSSRAQTNIVPSQITADVTWTGTNLLQNTITIRSGATVRVAPGARILLDSAATLVVNGALVAEGTETEPIYFTRPEVGRRWKGIRLIRAQDSRFAHCVFEFAECAGTHLDYYDNDCNAATTPPARNYHEAIVALASNVTFDNCLFQNLPDTTGAREGDAIAIISDDPQNPGAATARISNCRFISIGQAIHTRFSYILVEQSYFTDHHGDNDDIDMYGESNPPPLIQFNQFINPAHDDAINPTRCSAIIVGNVLSGGDDHGIVLRDRCSPIVSNNFISNFAAAGISVQNQCDALIVNNTIVNSGRGIRFFDHDTRWGAPYCLFPGSGKATIVNTIIWNCPQSLTLADSPYTADRGSHATVAFCNIQGGQASASVSANSTLTWLEGNRSIDPLFGPGFFLTAASPMIDAGTNRFGTLFTSPHPLDGNGDGVPASDIGSHDFLLETADSNADGIPDGWTVQYGFHPGVPGISSADPDGDLATTFEEWIANTNPTNALSVLKLRLAADQRTLSFPVPADRNIVLQYATNLVSPEWIDLTEVSGGTSAMAPTNQSGFFRVRARLP